MCWLVVLVLGIIFVRRIPVIQRTHPNEFPSYSEDSFRAWRRKSLGAVYTFLGSSVGCLLALTAVAQAAASEAMAGHFPYWAATWTMVFLGLMGLGAVIAIILAAQAAQIKRAMLQPRLEEETPY